MARAARHFVERVAEVGRRGLELLREDDLLLASQRARAADLLEVRLERASLAAASAAIRHAAEIDDECEGGRAAEIALLEDLGP